MPNLKIGTYCSLETKDKGKLCLKRLTFVYATCQRGMQLNRMYCITINSSFAQKKNRKEETKLQSLSNVHVHAVFSSTSRDSTAAVRRRHGELRVLIKALFFFVCFFYISSMCSSYARQKEGGGLLNSCLLWTNHKVNKKIHPLKECLHSYAPEMWSTRWEGTELHLNSIFFNVSKFYQFWGYIFLRIVINGKQSNIVPERQYCPGGDWHPVEWNLVSFQSWYQTPQHVMEGDTYCIRRG